MAKCLVTKYLARVEKQDLLKMAELKITVTFSELTDTLKLLGAEGDIATISSPILVNDTETDSVVFSGLSSFNFKPKTAGQSVTITLKNKYGIATLWEYTSGCRIISANGFSYLTSLVTLTTDLVFDLKELKKSPINAMIIRNACGNISSLKDSFAVNATMIVLGENAEGNISDMGKFSALTTFGVGVDSKVEGSVDDMAQNMIDNMEAGQTHPSLTITGNGKITYLVDGVLTVIPNYISKTITFTQNSYVIS